MSDSRSDRELAQQELLRAVYDYYMEAAEWPLLEPLQLELRQFGSLEAVAAAIGREIINCGREGKSSACRLTLQAIVRCQGEELDISRFLHAVRKLFEWYVVQRNTGAVLLSELPSDSSLTALELGRVRLLLENESAVWQSFGREGPYDAAVTPSRDIWYFEDVHTLGDYRAVFVRMADERQVAMAARLPAASTAPRISIHRRDVPNERRQLLPYVDPSRMDELRAIKSADFDLRRLIALCEELNIAAANGCHFATIMLTRAIIDHVPPVFGAKTFAEVTSSYPAAKSFKDSMQHLSTSARRIADAHLHIQIRRKEALPTATQVDFSRDLDVLLGEVVRVLL